MSSVASRYRKGPNQCPDPAEEKRELRRMVRKRDKEIERLRKALRDIRRTANELDAEGLETRDIWLTAHTALDGGGGDDDE